ncbi:MAG: type II secretion system protein J [Phycisphaeraceae bacterium]
MNTHATEPQPRRHARAAGHTLVEMVLSLTLLAIVMASAGSAMLFAAKASPSLNGPTATLINDSNALGRMVEDLAQAKYVLVRSSTAVKILVNDRTGDGVPDHITYDWSGVAGDPLTYAINDSTPVAIVEQVDSFALDYKTTERTITIGGETSMGAEVLLASRQTTSTATWPVNSSKAIGQRFTPSLSAQATGYRVTRVEVYGQSAGAASAQMPVQIRDINADTPDSTVYATQTLFESDLPSSFGWASIAFSTSETIPAGQESVMVIGVGVGEGTSGSFGRDEIDGNNFVYTNDGGGSWQSTFSGHFLHRIYGKEVVATPRFDVTREHVTSVSISLQSSASDRSPLTRQVTLLLAPEVLETFWDADFNAKPPPQDLNDDGVMDWIYVGGGAIPDASLVGGVWNASSSLVPIPRHLIDGVVRVDVRLRATNGQRASVHGPYVRDGLTTLPIVCVLQEDGGGGQELVVYNDSLETSEITTVSGLDDGWVDLHLTVLPDDDVLYLKVNDVEYGVFTLQREVFVGVQGVWLTGSGDGALFADARVSVGGSYASND